MAVPQARPLVQMTGDFDDQVELQGSHLAYQSALTLSPVLFWLAQFFCTGSVLSIKTNYQVESREPVGKPLQNKNISFEIVLGATFSLEK